MSAPTPIYQDDADHERERLLQRLADAETALAAIRRGDVDARVVQGRDGPQVYTRRSADSPYRQLIEQMYEGAATVSDAGVLLYANRRMAELLGRPLEAVIGQPLAGFFPDEPQVEALLSAAAGPEAHASAELSTPAGVPLLLALSRLTGEAATFALVASDLTPHLLAQAAETQRQALEEQVATRTADLRVALEAAQAAARAKSTFLANMSHEIRTPLNGVLGMAHLMRMEPLSPSQSARLDVIDEAGHHLLDLIVNILDLSKIEAGAFKLEQRTLSPAAVVSQVLALVQPQAQRKGLRLVVNIDPDVPDPMVGDETRLRQALLNLAGNAVKFTDAGEVQVRVHVLEAANQAATLCFEVRDTGPGVPLAVAERLFQPFEQGDASMSRRFGGSGLGLAITRELAGLMGGSTGLRARPEGGSVFWFTARLARPEARPALATPALRPDTPQARIAAAHAGTRVLVVDDEPIGLEVASAMLQMAGLVAEGASGGLEALARLAGGPRFDLVLMDMQMPGMDGLACTRALRQLPGCAELPVIACTANAFAEHRLACEAAGMSDFLAKPLDPQALYRVLLQWLPGGERTAPHAGP